jgi:hypothetical protein
MISSIMLTRSKYLVSFALLPFIYVSYATPTPDIFGHFRGQPIEAFSFRILANRCGPVVVAPARRAISRGVLGLTRDDRRRCWILLRLVVDIFRHAPERRRTLERAITILATDLPRTDRGRRQSEARVSTRGGMLFADMPTSPTAPQERTGLWPQ